MRAIKPLGLSEHTRVSSEHIEPSVILITITSMYLIYYDNTNSRYGIQDSSEDYVYIFSDTYVQLGVISMKELPSTYKRVLDSCYSLHEVLDIKYSIPDKQTPCRYYNYILYMYRGKYYLVDYPKCTCYEVNIIDSKVMLVIVNTNISKSWTKNWTYISGGMDLLDCFQYTITGFKKPKEMLMDFSGDNNES